MLPRPERPVLLEEMAAAILAMGRLSGAIFGLSIRTRVWPNPSQVEGQQRPA